MRISKPVTLCLLTGLALLGAKVRAEQVTIAVAANFTEASREIASLFEKATGHTTKISYGSTGKLYSQIEFGAPFEVFLAADTQRPSKAENAGLAVPGSRFVYARGKLVLWSAKPDLFASGETFLKRGSFERIALANPKTAPYGLAAKQVMQHLGLLEQHRPNLVLGDSITQTFQFAATGNVDVGFVALAQTRSWRGDRGTLWQIPADYYSPIEQSAVLLKTGEANPAAAAYLEFLKSDAAREVIERFGYGVE
jgi:molybdate transport system substrate-binding protein